MSSHDSRRNVIVAATGLALLLVLVGLRIPGVSASVIGYGYYGSDTRTHERSAVAPSPTPEGGNRDCAISKIVGYIAANGEQHSTLSSKTAPARKSALSRPMP